MQIEKMHPDSPETFAGEIQTYAHLKSLVEQVSADGRLTRDEDEVIMSAIVASQHPTAEMCALFRSLQEKVWSGELRLE